MHINIAVSKAIVNRRKDNMKAKEFGNEVLFNLSPTGSVNLRIDNCIDYI